MAKSCPTPVTQAWPSVLAGLIGTDFVNLGCDGGSNRRIVRTTVASLDDICRDKSVEPREVLVCLWTSPDRYEYYSLKKEAPRNTRPDLPDEFQWHRLSPGLLKLTMSPSAVFYDHFWSEEGTITNFFLDLAMLDGFLRSAGYLSRYAFAWKALPAKIPEPARRFARLLNPETVFGGLPLCKEAAFTEMARAHAHQFGPEGHPLQEGHICFAETLASWLASDMPLEVSMR